MFRDEVLIREVKPSEVWPFIADPEMMRQWNPKLSGVSRGRKGLVQRGERYTVRYAMRGKVAEMVATVEECQPGSRLAVVHREADWPVSRYVLEAYDLEGKDGGTLVRQTIDLSRSGVPLWVRIMSDLIHRFGSAAEQSHLERLKALLEESGAAR